jgi:L-amino acid N-acyltransferase YncA
MTAERDTTRHEVRGQATVRAMTVADWSSVRAIYEAGIATGNATFETTAPTWQQWDTSHLIDHRAVDGAGDVVGWAALAAVSERCVYAGVAENSVYVHPDWHGRGTGSLLLRAIIDSAEASGIWTLQTGIFPENTASITLHERCGFRIVGRRERIGQLAGTWRDTLFLERRSLIAGA